MDNKISYEKVDINIAIGNTSFSQQRPLTRKGKCKGVKVVPISPITSVTDTLNIAITVNNNDIFGATDVRDFIPVGGGYKSGFKSCSFDVPLTVSVDAISASNIATNDFKAQLIFMIEEDCAN